MRVNKNISNFNLLHDAAAEGDWSVGSRPVGRKSNNYRKKYIKLIEGLRKEYFSALLSFRLMVFDFVTIFWL